MIKEIATPGISRRVRWLLLLMFAVVIALMRLHTYNEPTDRDQANYAVIAHEVLLGKRIYAGVLLDQKPPAIDATYGIGELIAGYGRQQIYLLNVGAAIITMLGFYSAGRTLGHRAGLYAAAIWTIVSGHLALEANQPNSEVFINAWTVFALATLLRRPVEGWNWRPAVVAGCCFAAASLYKHVVVLIPAFVLLANLCWTRQGTTRRAALLDIIVIAGIGILAWVLLFAYFAVTGRLHSMINCLFLYNRYYSGDVQKNFVAPFTNPESIYSPALLGLTPLMLFALLAIVLMWKARDRYRAGFLIGLAFGTGFAVALPGRFYPHYYQLWYPFLVLGAVFAIEFINRTEMTNALVRRILGPALVLLLIGIELPNYFKSPEEWSRAKYGEIFVVTDELAKKIKAMLKPGEVFWQLGSQTQLYMDTKQRPPTALVDYGMFSGPLSAELSGRTMQALEAHPPDLLVVEHVTISHMPPGHVMLSWIEGHYELAPRNVRGQWFTLWIRKGSDLERRLQRNARS